MSSGGLYDNITEYQAIAKEQVMFDWCWGKGDKIEYQIFGDQFGVCGDSYVVILDYSEDLGKQLSVLCNWSADQGIPNIEYMNKYAGINTAYYRVNNGGVLLQSVDITQLTQQT